MGINEGSLASRLCNNYIIYMSQDFLCIGYTMRMRGYQFIHWASYVSINVYRIINSMNSFSVCVLTSSLVCVCVGAEAE